jgi:hypothetical protein
MPTRQTIFEASAQKMVPSVTVCNHDNPLLDLPITYKNKEWNSIDTDRSGVERIFSQQHVAFPPRNYRSAKMWEVACVMHTLYVQHRFLATKWPRGPNDALSQLPEALGV